MTSRLQSPSALGARAAASLARDLVRAGRPEEALAVLDQALDQALNQALNQALDQALHQAPGQAPDRSSGQALDRSPDRARASARAPDGASRRPDGHDDDGGADGTPPDEPAIGPALLTRIATLNFGLGRVDEADGELAAARRRVRDPGLLAALIAQQGYHLAARGECRKALAVLDAAPPARPAAPAHPIAVAARATALTQLGRCRQAAALCDAALEAGVPPGMPPVIPEPLPALRAARQAALLLAGDAAAARAGLAEAVHGEPPPPAAERAPLELCLAQAERTLGAIGAATRLARSAESALAGTWLHAAATGELAHLAALRGDLAEAEEALAAARRAASPAARLDGLWAELAEPWVVALRDGQAAGAAAALAAAGRARAAGAHGFELLALHDVVRLAPPRSVACRRAATRLADLAVAFEGALAKAAAAHARAAAAGDPAALTAASHELERIGLPLPAAEAAAQAADLLGAAGREIPARAAHARAWYLGARCEGARTPALARVREPRLTAREGEVAALAAGGLSSKQIAARLAMSVRTVDNHLRAVYLKLGIAGRTELIQVGVRPPAGIE